MMIRFALIALSLGICLSLTGCLGPNLRPELIRRAEPLYPAKAKAQGIEGSVVVTYSLDDQGQVLRPTVVESNPPGVFDRAAIEAISRWRFRPRKFKNEVIFSSKLIFTLQKATDKPYPLPTHQKR